MKTKTKTLPKLKHELEILFNKFIRLRDRNLPCISCGEFKPLQAGHFYPVRGYDGLRFDEDNCHGECVKCNLFNDAHLISYSVNLVRRIGGLKYAELTEKANNYKKNGYKFTRSELLEKIEIYKEKIKEING